MEFYTTEQGIIQTHEKRAISTFKIQWIKLVQACKVDVIVPIHYTCPAILREKI
jgi:hypothetical protein